MNKAFYWILNLLLLVIIITCSIANWRFHPTSLTAADLRPEWYKNISHSTPAMRSDKTSVLPPRSPFEPSGIVDAAAPAVSEATSRIDLN